MTKIYISHNNYWYDYTNNYYCYDLNIENYVPASSAFIPRTPGSKYRAFRITTISENLDWNYLNQVMNQCFSETITIYMSNSKWISGVYTYSSTYCNSQTIGKQNNSRIGYWNCFFIISIILDL